METPGIIDIAGVVRGVFVESVTLRTIYDKPRWLPLPFAIRFKFCEALL